MIYVYIGIYVVGVVACAVLMADTKHDVTLTPGQQPGIDFLAGLLALMWPLAFIVAVAFLVPLFLTILAREAVRKFWYK